MLLINTRSEGYWQKCIEMVNKVMVRNVDLDLFS